MHGKKIAELAGVSVSTVSKVLNNYPNVSEKTRKKVLKVIEENKYVPNLASQLMHGKSIDIIGVFIVELNPKNRKSFSLVGGAYYPALIGELIDETKKYGYSVLVTEIISKEEFQLAEKRLKNKSISGAIFIGAESNEEEIIDFMKTGYNIALINHGFGQKYNFSNVTFINSNNYENTKKIMSYLYKKGHRKIAHLIGENDKYSSIERFRAYRDYLQDVGINYDENLTEIAGYLEDDGYKAVKKLLRKSIPTAIFATNDNCALGALKGLKELGYKVPEDISIIGYDNIEKTAYMNPSVTTLDVSIKDMARLSVKAIMEYDQNTNNCSANYFIEGKIIERDSVKSI